MRTLLALFLLAWCASAADVLVRVTDDDHPVADARVVVLTADQAVVFDPSSFLPTARTDAAGVVLVEARPGARVLVYRAGFAVVIRSVQAPIVDVALRWETPFSGTLEDEEGQPVAGADVALKTSVNETITFVARSDGKGKFAFFGLIFDTYELAVKHDSFLDYFAEAKPADSRTTHTLTRPGGLRGRVVDRADQPVADVSILIDAEEHAKTDAEGRYTIEKIEPGAYMVSLRWIYGDKSIEATVLAGKTVVVADLVFTPSAIVVVRVHDANKTPLEGVQVASFPTNATTDKEGVARAAARAGVAGKIRISAEGYYSDDVAHGALEPGREHTLDAVELIPYESLSVLVRGANGLPIPEGTLRSRGGQTVTLKNGAGEVFYGDWTLLIPGAPPREMFVREETVIDLPPLTVLRARLVDEFGEPVTDFLSPVTDKDGRFTAGPIWGLEHYVSVRASAMERRESFIAAQASEQEVELRVVRPQRELLFGRVTRDGKPVTHFSVFAGEFQNFVNEDGRFAIRIDRSKTHSVRIGASGLDDFTFAIPARGDELLAEIPERTLIVVCEGVGEGHRVRLLRHGSRSLPSKSTDASGVARFVNLERATYHVSAQGMKTAWVAVKDSSLTVRLLGDPSKPRWTIRPAAWHVVSLKWGVAKLRDTPYDIAFLTVAEPEREQVIDLDPTGGGWLVVRASGTPYVSVTRIEQDYTTYFADPMGAKSRMPLRAGTYAVEVDQSKHEVTIRAGEETRLDLSARPRYDATIAVRFADGKTVAGATGTLGPEGVSVVADERGVLRFVGLFSGTYLCRVERDGWLPASSHLTVSDKGTTSWSRPMVLRRATGHIRIVDDSGGGLAIAIQMPWGEISSDDAGFAAIHGPSVRLSLARAPWVRIDDRRVDAGAILALRRAGDLDLLTDAAPDRVTVRAEGRTWPPSRVEARGRLSFELLPPGPVEIEIVPKDSEDRDSEAAEPVRKTAEIAVGRLTTVDFRDS